MYAKMGETTNFSMVSEIEQTPGAYILNCEERKVTKASLLL